MVPYFRNEKGDQNSAGRDYKKYCKYRSVSGEGLA